MQFYFIRHAQSENNALWDRTGSSVGRSVDAELTEVGWQQARLLARFIHYAGQAAPAGDNDYQNVAGFGITHLYCSLMVRAVATGTVLAEAIGLPPVAWEDLHEEGGIYQKDEQTGEVTGLPGKDRAYFEAHYPGLVLPESVGQAGWWNRPYEGQERRPERARRFLRDLLERHGGAEDKVAVVSHGGFYNLVMADLLNLDRDGYWFIMNNAAITRIDFHAEGTDLVYTNRVDFLPRELIT